MYKLKFFNDILGKLKILQDCYSHRMYALLELEIRNLQFRSHPMKWYRLKQELKVCLKPTKLPEYNIFNMNFFVCANMCMVVRHVFITHDIMDITVKLKPLTPIWYWHLVKRNYLADNNAFQYDACTIRNSMCV